jgi:hypothetical protein
MKDLNSICNFDLDRLGYAQAVLEEITREA